MLPNIMWSFVDGPGSAVGIATGYGLDCPGIEARWGARFSVPVQTGPVGTRWRSWLRHCATIRKVAGSIPDGVIGIFH